MDSLLTPFSGNCFLYINLFRNMPVKCHPFASQKSKGAIRFWTLVNKNILWPKIFFTRDFFSCENVSKGNNIFPAKILSFLTDTSSKMCLNVLTL